MKSSTPKRRSILRTFVESVLKLEKPVFKRAIVAKVVDAYTPKHTKSIKLNKRIKRLKICRKMKM